MPRTIAFLNKQGGVGKTSTVHHLAGTLARRGLRSCSSTPTPGQLDSGVLGPEATELDPRVTIAAIFDDAVPSLRVTWSGRRASTACPSSRAPRRRNSTTTRTPGSWDAPVRAPRRDRRGRRTGHDLVLIDCPPHIQLWAWSALVAADGVVVPLHAEDYGRRVKAIRRTIAHVRAECQRRPRPGRLPGDHVEQVASVHMTYEHYLRQLHGDDVFTASVVPLAKDFKEAVTYRKPIIEYKPRSAAAKAIAALADEFIARLDTAFPSMPTDHGGSPDGQLQDGHGRQHRRLDAGPGTDSRRINGLGNRPGVDHERQSEGRRRLDAAAVIHVDRIVPDPNQPRTEFDAEALHRLAAEPQGARPAPADPGPLG